MRKFAFVLKRQDQSLELIETIVKLQSDFPLTVVCFSNFETMTTGLFKNVDMIFIPYVPLMYSEENRDFYYKAKLKSIVPAGQSVFFDGPPSLLPVINELYQVSFNFNSVRKIEGPLSSSQITDYYFSVIKSYSQIFKKYYRPEISEKMLQLTEKISTGYFLEKSLIQKKENSVSLKSLFNIQDDHSSQWVSMFFRIIDQINHLVTDDPSFFSILSKMGKKEVDFINDETQASSTKIDSSEQIFQLYFCLCHTHRFQIKFPISEYAIAESKNYIKKVFKELWKVENSVNKNNSEIATELKNFLSFLEQSSNGKTLISVFDLYIDGQKRSTGAQIIQNFARWLRLELNYLDEILTDEKRFYERKSL